MFPFLPLCLCGDFFICTLFLKHATIKNLAARRFGVCAACLCAPFIFFGADTLSAFCVWFFAYWRLALLLSNTLSPSASTFAVWRSVAVIVHSVSRIFLVLNKRVWYCQILYAVYLQFPCSSRFAKFNFALALVFAP